MLRWLFRGAGYVIYLLVVVFILLEIILRIYNPINPRLKGEQIVLPIRQRYEVRIDNLPGVKPKAIHTKNSLGFRGPEPPANWAEHLTIVAVGGSTTESFFLPDGTDWPTVLGTKLRPSFPAIWINNAGLNGHSTFGHQILLDDHVAKLKPDLVLFLVGVNDVGRDQLSGFDGSFLKGTNIAMGDSWWKDWGRAALKQSEVAGLVRTVLQGVKTRRMRFRDNLYVKLNPADTLPIPESEIQAELLKNQTWVNAYRQRLTRLISTCRGHGIEPVLITQPLLVGYGIDPVTGTDLAKARLSEKENGEFYWRRLEAYNQATRSVASQHKVHLIDLAQKLPKNSAYFYDEMHYTEAGSEKVAEIVATDLGPYLASSRATSERSIR